MKEHKNPKVLSEGLLWMVSAVEDFGLSLLKLKVFGSSSSSKVFGYSFLSEHCYGSHYYMIYLLMDENKYHRT